MKMKCSWYDHLWSRSATSLTKIWDCLVCGESASDKEIQDGDERESNREAEGLSECPEK